MTVSSETSRVNGTGNGVTTSFGFPYYVIAAAHLKVYVDGVLKTLTTDYTLSAASFPSIAGTNVVFNSAPVADAVITIDRDPPLTQLVDLIENDELPVETAVELVFDQLTMLIHKRKEVDARSLKLPLSSTLTEIDWPVGASAAIRASKHVRWNAAGDGLELVTVGTDAVTGVITTKGDLIQGGTSGIPERLAIGVLGGMLYVASTLKWAVLAGNTTARKQVLSQTGDGSASAVPAWADHGPFFKMPEMSNGTDAANDIDFTAGECWSQHAIPGSRAFLQAAAMTKQLDAVWAAGSAAGGRVGALADGTWHCYIFRPTSGADDFFFEQSLTPTPPSGTTYKWIGAILRESAAIVAFSQLGDEFLRKTTVEDVSAMPNSSAAQTGTLSVITGVKVTALMRGHLIDPSNANRIALVSSFDENDQAPNPSAAPGANLNGGAANTGESTPLAIRTNTSAQVRYRLGSADADLQIDLMTYGWVVDRSRI